MVAEQVSRQPYPLKTEAPVQLSRKCLQNLIGLPAMLSGKQVGLIHRRFYGAQAILRPKATAAKNERTGSKLFHPPHDLYLDNSANKDKIKAAD